VIDSHLTQGNLSYGELLLPGQSEEEVLLSTYICHPSLANNELSGPVVTAALGCWLLSIPNRRLSYRIVFAPETIGALVYLSRNLTELKSRTIAGYVVTCVGDDRCYSLLTSRAGNTLADKVARYVLREHAGAFIEYSFLERGSDERQYCSPGIDLPVASVMRSKYGCYPEYHTSNDNLEFVTPKGLSGGFEALRKCLCVLEENRYYQTTYVGEPQMSKRGLYPSISKIGSTGSVRAFMDILAYADGKIDLLTLSEKIGQPFQECAATARRLKAAGLLE
jgi:aminopeptidase-like protein